MRYFWDDNHVTSAEPVYHILSIFVDKYDTLVLHLVIYIPETLTHPYFPDLVCTFFMVVNEHHMSGTCTCFLN